MNKLESVKRACKINDIIFKEVVKDFNFKTERDLEKYFLKRFRNFGAGRAYRPIVANNNSVIHAVPRNKKFGRGFLVLDFGSKVNGWCSDMTRTIFLGKADSKEKELYNLVLNCQRKCVSKVREGRECFDLEVLSRKLLGDYRRYYKHRVGHGIGKMVHTDPRFGVFTSDVLKSGDIIALEPGIYIKEKGKNFGIRVEDTIFVKKNGFEVLSKSSKKFTEIKNFR